MTQNVIGDLAGWILLLKGFFFCKLYLGKALYTGTTPLLQASQNQGSVDESVSEVLLESVSVSSSDEIP